MRLSATSPLDSALSPWAEHLRARLDLPLLVRWNGGNGLRRLLAFACVNAGCALVGYGWWLQFWGW